MNDLLRHKPTEQERVMSIDYSRIGTPCDGGDCDRTSVSLAYDEKLHGLIPVCRRHILVYKVHPTRNARDKGRTVWQAEDEYAGLRFARRSRWRWLAQRRILRDQREALDGRESRAQSTRRKKADARPDHADGSQA